MDSILLHTKKALGISDGDDSFDLDVIMYINNAFSNLNDLGAGPVGGFVITGEDEVWTDFFPQSDDPIELNVILSKVQTYVVLKTRIIFDPPTVPTLMTSIESQIKEAEWRINVNRESGSWAAPNPTDILVVDGGDPTGP